VQLSHLKVRNIRSYANADLPLRSGTTLLVGDVGAGKTSLLYAIEMALFGFSEVDPVHLIRHRSRDAEVVLGLTDGSHTYELRRRFSRKSRKGKEVFEAEECVYGADGAVQKYSPTELRQRAIDLLGFPDNPNPRAHSDLWRWAVYIPQERMRDVLAQDPSERRETVRKALGLEQYKTAADNALLLARAIGTRGRSLEDRAEMLVHFEEELGRFTRDRDGTLQQLHELRTAAASADAARTSAETAVVAAEQAARAVALDRAALVRLNEEIDQLLERLLESEAQRDETVHRLDATRPGILRLDGELAKRTEIQTTWTALRAEVDRRTAEESRSEAARRERTGAESALAAATSAWTRIQEELHRARTDLQLSDARWNSAQTLEPSQEPVPRTRRLVPIIDSERSALRLELDAAQSELAERRPLLVDLESLLTSGNCPRCHQRVDPASFGAHRDEAVAAIEASEARVRAARAAVDGVEEEREGRLRFERELSDWNRAEEVRREALRQRKESAERAERARQAAQASETHRDEAATRLAAMGPVAVSPEGPTILATARSRLTELDRIVSDLTRAEERRASLVQRVTELESERATRDRELSGLRRSNEEAQARRSELSKRLVGDAPDRALEQARMTARAAQERTETLGREIARRETELTVWSGRIKEAEVGRARRTQLLSQADAERALAAFLQGPFREALTTLEERLLQRAQREFERMFSRSFQTLVEDPTIAARTDGAFTPAVEIDGEWTPAEALSGGERTALALAFRIALGQVIRGAGRLRLQTLILDEPTDGFSPEQVIRVGELLRNLGLPQVILVSHETGLAAVADAVVRISKVEGVSVLHAEDSGGGDEARGADRPERTAPGMSAR
jgi:exonuclease SbcC